MNFHIAIEAGATRTSAGLYDDELKLIREVESGGANPVEMGMRAAGRVLVGVVRDLMAEGSVEVGEVIAGVAGAGKGNFAVELAGYVCRETGVGEVRVCNDILPILRANLGDLAGILVIAGTGSSVLVQDEDGNVELIGGAGSLVGDRGSGYRLGLEVLQACSASMDGTSVDTDLLYWTLKTTDCSDLDELVQWSGTASKTDVADLAKIVVQCATEGDVIAQEIVEAQAVHLAEQTMAARNRGCLDSDTPIPILMYGGLLTNSEVFADAYAKVLMKYLPDSIPALATITGHRAVSIFLGNPPDDFVTVRREECADLLPGTERTLRSEKSIDVMTGLEITNWMTGADGVLFGALQDARESIGAAIETAAACISAGGRIIYLGAGTSGRLGVLDASECPPTFGIGEDRVIGLIAGGDHALRNSIEGAEDSFEQAGRDLEALSPVLSENDFVVGITASGTTPYVLGGLAYARSAGAKTCLMACNAVSCDAAQQFILLETGPEVLPGSTRLKAGTATKLALNQITTGAMARCGHIYEGYMVGVKAVNAKLEERTVRIAAELLEISIEQAEAALGVAEGDIKVAVLMHRLDITKADAVERLSQMKGHLRDALDL
jgi:N-acetylmuramic acid 6-phosphate etherase